ncbi:MAG: hypothetical protein COZ80_12380 [Ignavibacteria bacterium CG_4_8_14_3_um_filter_37_9]|nr:MAG: hypothetical protein AUJ54_07375 [Ignavibacteria bacterium CG1_02_37_35]PIW98100.1 MAG: hypothetical protein COZ80_12380 [Ignavibacteria bacterium CG_4_8_14_3_um_filter_37_9]
MVLDIIISKALDGYSAAIPSIKGCETWAEKEDEAIEKIVSLAKYYLKLDEHHKVLVDKAGRSACKSIYKLIFHLSDGKAGKS